MLIDELAHTLTERQPLPTLCPREIYDAKISATIKQSSDDDLFGAEESGALHKEMRSACRSGLLLLNDDLDASHQLSQSIETPTGSFWHAIMHRREGDFSNSNYWWRRVGDHPAFEEIYRSVAGLELSGEAAQFVARISQAQQWLPEEYVALCERTAQNQFPDDDMRRIQLAEMQALYQWCRARV